MGTFRGLCKNLQSNLRQNLFHLTRTIAYFKLVYINIIFASLTPNEQNFVQAIFAQALSSCICLSTRGSRGVQQSSSESLSFEIQDLLEAKSEL